MEHTWLKLRHAMTSRLAELLLEQRNKFCQADTMLEYSLLPRQREFTFEMQNISLSILSLRSLRLQHNSFARKHTLVQQPGKTQCKQ